MEKLGAWVRNAADRKQVKRARNKESRAERQYLNDLRVVLKSVEGRRVLWQILSHCRVYSSSYLDSADSHGTAFNEGMREAGRQLMMSINQVDSELLHKIGLEAARREKNFEAEKEASHIQSIGEQHG